MFISEKTNKQTNKQLNTNKQTFTQTDLLSPQGRVSVQFTYWIQNG